VEQGDEPGSLRFGDWRCLIVRSRKIIDRDPALRRAQLPRAKRAMDSGGPGGQRSCPQPNGSTNCLRPAAPTNGAGLQCCAMRRLHQALLGCALLLAAQLLRSTPVGACEMAHYGRNDEQPDFCRYFSAAIDFEVLEVLESQGDDVDGMYSTDDETGERSPTATWRPDAYEGPHLDLRYRTLARYGEPWPRRVALIEVHFDETPLSRPRFAPGTRWRMYLRREPLSWRREQVVIIAECSGNFDPLLPQQGPPRCPFARTIERPAAQRHGCAACSAANRRTDLSGEAALLGGGSALLLLRRRRARERRTGRSRSCAVDSTAAQSRARNGQCRT
jgi:hypothetical protein